MPKEVVFLFAVLLTFVGGIVTGLSRRLQQFLFFILVLSTMRLNPDVQFGFIEELDQHRGTVWGFRYTVTDLLGFMLLISLIVGSLSAPTRFQWLPRGSFAMWMLIGASMLSLVSASVPLAGWFEINNLVLGFLIFVAAANFVRTEADLRFAALTLLWALAIPAALGFKQHFQFLLGQRYMARVRGTTPHPNLLAMYLNALFPLCLVLTLSAKSWARRLMLLGLCGLTAAAVMFTLSRGGVAGLVFATGLTLLLWLMLAPARGKIPKLLIILVLLSPVGVKWGPLFVNRMTSREAEVSKMGREEMTTYAIAQWQDHKVVGIGINNYAVLREAPNVHNSYVLFLVETGIVGLLAFLFVLVTVLCVAIRNIFRAPPDSFERLFSIALSAGLAALYLQLYAEFAIRSENMHYLFHVLAGLVAGSKRLLINQLATAAAAKVQVKRGRRRVALAHS